MKLPRRLYLWFLQEAERRGVNLYDMYFAALSEWAVQHGFACRHEELSDTSDEFGYRKCRKCGLWIDGKGNPIPMTRLWEMRKKWRRMVEEGGQLLGDIRFYTHLKHPEQARGMDVPVIEEE